MAAGWLLVYHILLYCLSLSLRTVTPMAPQGNNPLATSADVSVGEQVCFLQNDAMCTSSFFRQFGGYSDFLAFWRTLRGRQRFKFARLFTYSKTCNDTIGNKMAAVYEVFGLEGKKGKKRDMLLDIGKMKRLLQCRGINDRNAIARVKRNAVTNETTGGNTFCWRFWLGDGFCDLGCNTEEYDYDDGDCCYKTCAKRVRRYPCGYTGFQCKQKISNAPGWIKDIKFCFKWRPNGDGSQCDNSHKGKMCAPIGSMTKFYYDDTDERNGGCLLSWQIEAHSAPSWFWTRLRLCLFSYGDGDVNQCNYGNTNRVRCRSANSWVHYTDNTDNRRGGCFMRWKVLYLGTLPKWIENAKFCFYWRSSGGQCGIPGQASQNDNHCVRINSWTNPYRDDTDERDFGCQMAWGILL